MAAKPVAWNDLTPIEQEAFDEAKRGGNLNALSEIYFRSPQGFTRWWHDESVGHFRHLFTYLQLRGIWESLGKPDSFTITDVELKVEPDPDDFTIPSFVLEHGYLFLEWAKPFVSKEVNAAMAIAGSGLGKTSAVGIAALIYSVLYPGFTFFNAGPSEKQAQLMSGEIDTWISGSEFTKFIKVTPTGKLHRTRPTYLYTFTSPYNVLYDSHIECKTVGDDATNLIGMQGDWFNIEEFSLLANLSASIPKIMSRMRAMRPDGSPRWVKLSMIANPTDSPEVEQVEKRILAIVKDNDPSVRGLVLKNIPSSQNLYNTSRQLKIQRKMMDDIDAQAWIDGSSEAAKGTREIPINLIDLCRSEDMDREIREESKHKAKKKGTVGLVSYEIAPEVGREYVVIGDPGMSDITRLSDMNVPVVIVLDMTDFPNQPIKLVSLQLIDGGGKYDPWIIALKDAMIAYRCHGYYDATNVQTAFQDENGSLKGWPSTPLRFNASNKPWSLTIFKRLMEAGMFEWPYIETLWAQARIYVSQGAKSKKIQDDLIACFLVFCLMLFDEQVLWVKLNNRFHWEKDKQNAASAIASGGRRAARYERRAGRYRR